MAWLCHSPAWVLPPHRTPAPAAATRQQPYTLAAGNGLLMAALPLPAYAGGMFDFGLTLPFVAITFILMMVTLNALFYSPVSTEMDERNAKLLETLSSATDSLTKADAIQVEYTAKIREAREKARAAVDEYRSSTEKEIATQIEAAKVQRDQKAAEVKARLDADVAAKKASAEAEIEKRKAAFVKEALAAVS